MYQVSSGNATPPATPLWPSLTLTIHIPTSNSSRHFGLIAVLVIGVALFMRPTVDALKAVLGDDSFVAKLHEWGDLLLQVDVAKAKVKP